MPASSLVSGRRDPWSCGALVYDLRQKTLGCWIMLFAGSVRFIFREMKSILGSQLISGRTVYHFPIPSLSLILRVYPVPFHF